MAVSSSLHVGVFPSRVRSTSKIDLFAKTLLPPSPSPAAAVSSPSPAISLKLGPRQTAALRRRLKPVQAQHGSASASEFVFYPHRFARILTLLPTLPDVRARCQQIERYGLHLPCVPTPFVTAANRVEDLPASSNTYVHALLDPSASDPSLVYFYVHSDAAHIRGLAVILVAGLSGAPLQTVADMSLVPYELLIGRSLLPARWCSQFMLLLEHMQHKARELLAGTGSSNKRAAEDVLSIMGLGSFHAHLKDEMDKTRAVHESLSLVGLGMDDSGDDDVYVQRHDGRDADGDLERKKYDEDSFVNEDDPSWRVKRYAPMHTVLYYEDGNDSIASPIPPRWGR